MVAGLIETDDIKESSGLSASECQDVLWTHNDSGNDALIYAMSTEANTSAWRADGAPERRLGVGRDLQGPGGKCFLLLGDIGDNDETRGEVEIYRIPEPTASAETASSTSATPLGTEPVQTMRFSYPNGSNDAETLLVHPWTGDIYVVTREERTGRRLPDRTGIRQRLRGHGREDRRRLGSVDARGPRDRGRSRRTGGE